MNWPIGTGVVCVDASGAPPLVEGAYYTIRSAHTGVCRGVLGPSVYLHEIQGPRNEYGQEWGYRTERFRIAESTHTEAGSVREGIGAIA